jgi:hypothetical protein
MQTGRADSGLKNRLSCGRIAEMNKKEKNLNT